MPTRTANAQWNGDLKGGNGSLSFGNGAYSGQYSFSSRFEEGAGTNPEELIAAAHSGCFSMAFAATLAGAGFTPDWVKTTAKVSVDPNPDGSGFTITRSALDTEAAVPGISPEQFEELAQQAKAGCPVSRALGAIDISLNARLTQSGGAG
jgi:osmotically inducible protein OsmC